MRGGPVTRGPFVSYQVNVDALGNNITGDAANEPSIANNTTNPDNIIIGFRQPRYDYTATQYFAALLPDRGNSVFPGENRRVFYVERLVIDRADRCFKKERLAVATLILDTSASETIFNDPNRMSIDVMADGARRWIGELDLTGMH